MSIKCLAHVCIKTTDLEKTCEFYCGALGMSKLFSFTRRAEIIGFYLKASATTFIEVFQASEIQRAGEQRNLHHFCLETDDIEGIRISLTEKGYAPGEIKKGCDHSFQFWVKDPNGVDIEFHQYTEESSQLTGESVEVDW